MVERDERYTHVTHKAGWSLTAEKTNHGVAVVMVVGDNSTMVHMDCVQGRAFAEQVLRACPRSWIVKGGKQRQANG